MTFPDNASGLKRWGPNMVADVDIVYKSNIPVLPDLELSITPGRLMPELEYDFVYERQAIADHDEYLKLKQLSEQQLKPSLLITEATTNTSTGATTTTTTTTNSEQLSNQSCATATAFIPASCTVTETASSLSPALHPQQLIPVITTGAHNVPQSHPMLAMVRTPMQPVATRYMLPDNVLQPQKPHRHHSGGLTEMNPLPQLPTTCPLIPERGSTVSNSKPTALNYLNEFEANSDDPFASVELKAINELEELRAVLQPPSVPISQNVTRFTAPTTMRTSSYKPQPYPITRYTSDSRRAFSRLWEAPLTQSVSPHTIRPSSVRVIPASHSFYVRPTIQNTMPAVNPLIRQPPPTDAYNVQLIAVPGRRGSLSLSAPDLKNLQFRHRNPS